jgi:hypothetical protein
MSVYSIRPLVLGGVRTYPLSTRKSKVSARQFAKPVAKRGSLRRLLDSLPEILAAQDLRDLLSAVQHAKKQKRAVLWGIGGHVIKVGLGPLLIDLMKKGFVSGVAMNGAALIHDFEIALVGNTSEDVEAGIGAGAFGMAEETGRTINEIAKLAQRLRMGYGEAAGQYLSSAILSPKHSGESVLMEAYRLRIPVTVHLAIGTDIPHMHPAADGAALGVYLNWGSAVLLPEVFLKAVSVVRNLGVALHPITTANFDFIQHYRPLQNVVKRPTAASKQGTGKESRGFAITGHHELLFPLVAAALAEGWPKSAKRRRA